MKHRHKILSFVCLLLLSALANHCHAFSFDLDSIASMGKFPRFVVNTYRWGDKFFNGYDTAYVRGTGYKFNAKITTDNWLDGYHFQLPNKTNILMYSDPSTSVGLYVTYLALSAGYDVNISKLLNGPDKSRRRLRFGFNCMLFAVEAYFTRNDVGTTIRRFGIGGEGKHLNVPFNALLNETWGIDAYYFLTHKRYSEAAAFSFSRIQRRSAGSFYTGFSIYHQSLKFNFSGLPRELLEELPPSWHNYRYNVDTYNYAVRLGYGYNWCFSRRWTLGVSMSPIIGIRKGYVNSNISEVSLSLFNRAKLSVVWNCGRWFFGSTGKMDIAIINSKKTTYAGGFLSFEAVFGYRFNLW